LLFYTPSPRRMQARSFFAPVDDRFCIPYDLSMSTVD
jgi:hypothetical protein